MIKIFKKILYLLFSILLLISLFFLVDLTNIDNSYTNRSLIEIDSKNLNSISAQLNSFVIQTSDTFSFLKSNFKVVSKTKPSSKTLKNLIFAFNVCRFVKSNAIVIANKDATIGIGSGNTCDGQIQVFHDIMGLMDNKPPKHAKQYDTLYANMLNIVKRYKDDIEQL